jgi:hypothetical protein
MAGRRSGRSCTRTWAADVCTYQTELLEVKGSGKGPTDWLRVTQASVYLDHPVHAMAGHTVNIDLRDPAQGPAARVALELHVDAARALAESILRSIDAAPGALSEEDTR